MALYARRTSFQVPGESLDATFDQLYREHAVKVMRWAARLGGPGLDVDDVVQEVFLVVHRRLDTLRRDVQPAAWIFGITANIVKAHRRKLHVWRWVARLKPPELSQIVAPGPTPLESVEQRRAEVLVYEVLKNLSEEHRQAFVLFELEGLSTAEIADLTETTHVTARVRLHRARASFFRHLRRVAKREEAL